MKNILRRFQREYRLLLLMPEYVMGGAETQFRYFVSYAERNNWKLDVIVGHKFLGDNYLLEKDAGQMQSVRLYEAKHAEFNDGNDFSYILKQTLKNSLRAKYHACLIYHPAYLVFVPIMRILGIHVVYSERIDGMAVSRDKRLQRYLGLCNTIVANSDYGCKMLGGLTRRQIKLIRNGKPVTEQLPVNDNRKINRILVPGRVIARKNQIMLLYYLKECMEFEGKVIFAGNVEDKVYQRKLERFIRQNCLQERVVFAGHVEDMREEYEKADIVILPSYAEGTSNVVLEAYAYGRPVIVSDIAMEREVVRNPRLRFGLKGTEELDQCIKYIQSLSAEEYRNLLRENREFVLKNYNLERMAKQLYRVMAKA